MEIIWTLKNGIVDGLDRILGLNKDVGNRVGNLRRRREHTGSLVPLGLSLRHLRVQWLAFLAQQTNLGSDADVLERWLVRVECASRRHWTRCCKRLRCRCFSAGFDQTSIAQGKRQMIRAKAVTVETVTW